ncbi:Cold-regulated 413 inner membrane protein 2 chloroplastic [Zea mays]|uniref:Cold-regulated 413 inner membrane protein 2 chloroplastic n=1 Tax=Zea mays TaxID=4577 RepID=A0A1Q1BV18_MAIZE|nr:Cold-regulated 413 inner membrane protein 2 chloroplastic [Zea mays]
MDREFSETLDTPPHRLRREIENVHLYAARDPCSCRHRRRADTAEGASGSGRERRLSPCRARRRAGGDGRAQGMRLAAVEAAGSGPAVPEQGGRRRVSVVGAPQRAHHLVDLRRNHRSAISC